MKKKTKNPKQRESKKELMNREASATLNSVSLKTDNALDKIPDDAFLYIPASIYGEILGLVIGCSVEISWMGQIKKYKGGYVVTKIHVPKQICTSAETELDADELGVLEYECEDGKFKEFGMLMWWGHSHKNMDAFWSGTDHKAQEQLSKNGWFISTVFNSRFKYLTAYRQGGDEFYPPSFSDNLKTVIIPDDSITKIIEDNVEMPKSVSTMPSYNHNYNHKNSTYAPWLYDGTTGDSLLDDMSLSFAETMLNEAKPCNDREFFSEILRAEYGVSSTLAVDMYDDFVHHTGKIPSHEGELIEYVNKTYEIT